jgi:putative endonuclease
MRKIVTLLQPRPGGAFFMLQWLKQLLSRDPTATGLADVRGAEGERVAAEFLHHRIGYEIVVQNWRNPQDRREEIDLVCRDHEVLVFVEVKTRSADAQVSGFFAVDRRKKRALRRAIHAYLTQLRARPRTFRFDVAEVILAGNTPPQVLHFQNVPLFPKGYHVLRQ